MSHNEVNLQELAITTFQNMIDRATSYRAGEVFSDSTFDAGYGICDNIYKCMPDSLKDYHSSLNNLKNNVIRRLPSYSGEWHYPVKSATDGRTAEMEWDSNSNKWQGDYGLNRLNQTIELLEYIKTNWDQKLTTYMTAAQGMGIVVGTHVLCETDNQYYTLDRDDDSRDPYFVPFGEKEGRRSIHLDSVKVITFDKEKRSVSSYTNAIRKGIKKQEELQKRMDALQKELNKLKMERLSLDFGLKQQHSLKFV